MKPHSKKSIEEEYGITDSNGKPFEIPMKGSIGLLILGYRGLMAWRAKRIKVNENHTHGLKNERGK